ncbi:MAG: M61 family metallopeptidase [Pseudomonadota bacterium]|nr:MAG: M61 family metallopeptidase [Pseudomonadota bacterium]
MAETNAVHYRIFLKDPAAHLFEVSCRVTVPDPHGQAFALPAWIPGSYMVRDFARNVVAIDAQCASGPVDIRKIDKSTWRCAPYEGPLTVTCLIYAYELTVRSAWLDTTRGYFNGTSVFLAPRGMESQPCSVEIAAPVHTACANWRVATSLPKAPATEQYGFGLYQASDYDDLIDHPVEMGRFDLVSFKAGGISHDVVVSGRHRADQPRLARDLQRICETHIGMFGELPSIERYVFLVMAVGDGYGGLEHRASCSLLCKRSDLPMAGQEQIGEDYRTFLGLCSHEYFHTWNVKRIKPEAFVAYDLTREVHTRQLWAFEGITSYYDDLALVRSGLIKEESYLELLGQTATRVWRIPGRRMQSVADSSFDAWIKLYKPDENTPNAAVSYYSKGALLALAVDMRIRKDSGGQRTLDDLMRALWKEYGAAGRGVPEGAIEAMAATLAGVDLTDFFARYLHGTDDLPLAELLQPTGVRFVLRAAENEADKGGKADVEQDDKRPALGARTSENPLGARLDTVLSTGAAELAGLAGGDILVAIDGIRIDKRNLEKVINSYRAGDKVTAHAFRRDELMVFSVELQAAPLDTCEFVLVQDANETMLTARRSWLQPNGKNNG